MIFLVQFFLHNLAIAKFLQISENQKDNKNHFHLPLSTKDIKVCEIFKSKPKKRNIFNLNFCLLHQDQSPEDSITGKSWYQPGFGLSNHLN